MRTGKILMLLAGIFLVFVATGFGVGGGALVYAHTAVRGDDGYYTAPLQRFDAGSYAVTSQNIDVAVDKAHDDWLPFELGTARVETTGIGAKSLFVGIGPRDQVDAYLARSAHDEVTDISASTATYRHAIGEVAPAPPASQAFWTAFATGTGTQSVHWKVSTGEWKVVVMNADASPGVSFDGRAGINTGALLPIGLGMMGIGLVVAAVAALLLVGSLRTQRPAARPAVGQVTPAPNRGAVPLHFRGELDSSLNRGLWLVKWFLAIPHFLVLSVLWAMFAVVTVIAGVSILFTGRYPRSIFDFTVGVMRWTWRVSFYAFVLGTDRYPPFTIAADADYPADLSVEYPARLSQPLVLVKWWLLVFPHYVIISIFGGGLTWWTWSIADDQARTFAGGGLIGLLVLIAGVGLLFTRRYPRSIFDFVMGMERWTYRVLAYAALMTDVYPPFRLDNGSTDPSSVPTPTTLTPRPGAGVAPA